MKTEGSDFATPFWNPILWSSLQKTFVFAAVMAVIDRALAAELETRAVDLSMRG